MSVVADSSAMVAALTDNGAVGPWARRRLRGRPLLAPHLLVAEVAQVLRRSVRVGRLDPVVAGHVIAELMRYPITQVAFAAVAHRVWELRETVSAYDAWYVAVAEAARVPLVTLDARLARAPGPRCEFEVGPAA